MTVDFGSGPLPKDQIKNPILLAPYMPDYEYKECMFLICVKFLLQTFHHKWSVK